MEKRLGIVVNVFLETGEDALFHLATFVLRDHVSWNDRNCSLAIL